MRSLYMHRVRVKIYGYSHILSLCLGRGFSSKLQGVCNLVLPTLLSLVRLSVTDGRGDAKAIIGPTAKNGFIGKK